MMGAKFDIEKFNGTGDFGLWRIKMRALLIQHGCEAALEVLPADIEAQTKAELNKKAHSAVILCLGNKVLREVTGEMTAVGISEHIDEFNKIVLDLANIEVKFNDDLALFILLLYHASLSKHFVIPCLSDGRALTLEDRDGHTKFKRKSKERSKAKGMMVKDAMGQCSVEVTNRGVKIKGIGKVRIQLKDGSSFMLHNVRDNCIYSLDGHAMASELNASIEEKDGLRRWNHWEGLKKCILNGPYVPTSVLIQAVPEAEGRPAVQQHTAIETVLNMTPENKEHFQSEKEAIFLLLTGIGDEIYSTVDACNTANEMWIAIERLQQGESLNVQDVKTNLFWEFGKFTSRDGESMESYYSRFYKLMNELTRNNLQVTTMQVNVQFLQQLQPEWSRFVTLVKQSEKIDTISYHRLFDILKQFQKEVNDIRAERIAKSANPLALLAAAQPYSDTYYQAPKPQRSNATSSSTRQSASTRHKGKEVAKPITPQSESVSEEDSDPEQAQRDKEMQKNLALLAKYFKKLYKPTNNNLRTSSNSRNKTEDTTPRYNNDNQSRQFRNQRTMTVVGARETVGSQVVQQTGIQCFNCKGYGHYAKECRKPKRVKDYAYHKEKMMMCKQAEQGVPLQAEQADWLEDTDEEIDEQELEAHYSYMAKIQEVSPEESSSTGQPLEQVQNHDESNVYDNVRRHSEQPESINDTYVLKKDDSNVTPDSSNICTNDNQVDHLIANLTLDTEENKTILKQLKKANA
ncbi:retrovirus-related pol polyprotein from transposon TNT 1-94, partial [Tanacetum coccineum]